MEITVYAELRHLVPLGVRLWDEPAAMQLGAGPLPRVPAQGPFADSTPRSRTSARRVACRHGQWIDEGPTRDTLICDGLQTEA